MDARTEDEREARRDAEERAALRNQHRRLLAAFRQNQSRFMGLVRVISVWLIPARRRAAKAVFHPKRLMREGYFEL